MDCILKKLGLRIKIIEDKTLGDYNLQISDLTESDLGSYLCERTVNGNVIEKQVVIKLTVDKKITTNQSKITNIIHSTTEFADYVIK